MATIDQYNLLASDPFVINGTEEVTENLQLTPSTTSQEGVITGIVTASGGAPLGGATVKVFSSADVPIAHAVTNPQGRYTIPSVVSGSYKVVAAKNGYLTPVAVPVTVTANRPTTVDFTLAPDPGAALNTIYGIISETATHIPLYQAVVNTYLVLGAIQTLVSTTSTNTSGQYISPALADGDYVIIANKAGYDQAVSSTTTLSGSELASLDIALNPNAVTNTGTVSGLITDSFTLLPIGGATVALYQIGGTTETLISLTKTNGAGRYLFGSVAAANYVVKAFAQMPE